MAHARKESLATAAALFGDAATDSDFFSSLQEPLHQDTNAQHHPTDPTRHLSQDLATHPDDAADLFASTDTPSVDSLWDQTPTAEPAMEWATEQAGYHDGQHSQTGGNYEYSAQDGYAPPVAEDAYVDQGWYDEHGQWHEYDYQNQGQDWAHDPTYAAARQEMTYDQSYDNRYSNYDSNAYAATSTSDAYAPVTSGPYAPGIPHDTRHAYDAYKPPVSSYEPPKVQPPAPTSSGYATSSTTTPNAPSPRGVYSNGTTYAAPPSYDPYQPTATSYAPPTKPVAPAPPISAPYSSYAASYQTVTPKPSQHAADVYKATSYNAYDPPILDRPRKNAKTRALSSTLLPLPPTGGIAPVYGFADASYGAHAAPAPLAPPSPKSPSYGQLPPARSYQPVEPPSSMQPVNVQPVGYDPYSPAPQASIQPSQNGPHGPLLSVTQHASNAREPVSSYYQPPMEDTQAPRETDWRGANPHAASVPDDANGQYENGYQNGYGQGHSSGVGVEDRGYDRDEAGTPHYDRYNGMQHRYEDGHQSGDHYTDSADSMAMSAASTMVPGHTAGRSDRPYNTARTASISSTLSYEAPPPPLKSPPRTSRVVISPPSSTKAPNSVSGSLPTSPRDYHAARIGSPPVRYHSPPSKGSPSRSGTPSSVRSHVTSPDINARTSMTAARSSPRPESYQSSSSNASRPAAHLEAARSKIASPDAGVKNLPPPAKVNGQYDPYRPNPNRTMSTPAVEPVRQLPSLDSMMPRVASPLAYDHAEAPHQSNEPYNTYAPATNGPRRQTSEPADYGMEYHVPAPTSYAAGPVAQTEPVYSTRPSLESNHSTYAPSTTQTGGDDSLGRRASKAPIICFGFGGKVVSCFPSTADATAGFDVSLISRQPLPVSIRPLKDILTDVQAFPGPLFSDPGTPTVNITRTAAATVKTKKALVMKYLEDRATEVEEGLGHLPPQERSKASGKLCLLLLLKTMVENDGKLSGSPEIEKAVRHILVPRLKTSTENHASYGFTTPAADTVLIPGNGLSAYSSTANDTPLASYHVRPSALAKIQEYLLIGERRMAYRYALDERLWAHAMLIASSVDKEAWKEAVNEFVRTELGADGPACTDPANGREPLRVAYSLFAGLGYSAVEELLPPRSLTRTSGSATSLLVPPSPIPPATPILGNSAALPIFTANVPIETLCKWQDTAATIVANVTNGDVVALTGLGDVLMANKWAEAAHVCYLLSLQTSVLGGVGSPTAKVTLVGSESPQTHLSFHVDSDPLIFSEILEFALSLAPATKGQDAFSGIPHLQAYRLLHAFQLAEVGHISLAARYCEAIATSLRMSKLSSFFTPTFTEQLKELTDRLSGTPQLDKSGSWIARKMTKPSFATLGNWIESGVTSFIAGSGEESSTPPAESEVAKKEAGNTTAGPFAQFTVISSANTSPNGSSANLSSGAFAGPGLAPPSQSVPRRSGSALALRGAPSTLSPMDRSASAMDMRPDLRSAYSAGPQIFSANAATTSFYQAQSMYAPLTDGPNGAALDASESTETERPSSTNWWDSGDDASKGTPTPTTFYSASEDQGAFVSPMDSVAPSRPTSFYGTPRSMSVAPVEEVDEEDDLGFGNSSREKKQDPAKHQEGDEKKASPATPAKPPQTPASSEKPASGSATETKPSAGSWLPWKWGKKEESGPGPVRAKLGEESAFYYDKDLKKWVNKKAGGDASAAPAAPPPPPSRAPSRAQTASPGAGSVPSVLSRGATPPPRPQSSISAPTAISKGLPPRRSHLAESFVPTADTTSSLPTPGPAGTSSRVLDPDLVPPPLSSRSSAAAKRKGKSRYVDVFQQNQAS